MTVPPVFQSVDDVVAGLTGLEEGFLLVGTDQKEPWDRWTINWLGTVQNIGGLLKAEVARDLSDTVKLTVGAELPDGARVDSLGAFGKG